MSGASEERLRFIASNIVNQIADHYSQRVPSDSWAAVRQSSNDALDRWVVGMVQKAVHTCPRCDGAGYVSGLDGDSEPCSFCDGFGDLLDGES